MKMRHSLRSIFCGCLTLLLLLFILSGCAGNETASSLSSAASDLESSAHSELPGASPSPAPSKSPSPSPTATPTPEPEPEISETAIAVAPLRDDFLFETRDASAPLAPPEMSKPLWVEPTDDPMWYEYTLDSGKTAYVYAERVRRAFGKESLFQDYFSEKCKELQSQLPDGKYWNHMGYYEYSYGEETPWIVTDIPCDHGAYGETYCNFYNGAMKSCFYANTLCECLGFASLISDQFFGVDAPITTFGDYRLLRPGDHIRWEEWEHSLTVIYVSDYGVDVAECNKNYQDCLITWGRTLSWDEIRSYDWDATYFTRYPM